MNDVFQWASTAARGDAITYARGMLACMREENIIARRQDEAEPFAAEGAAAADAWQLYQAGKVTLVQRRHGPMDYSYIAQKL